MKRFHFLILFLLLSVGASAQTTPWTASPVVTWQTRSVGVSKEIRAIQSPSFVFAIKDSLNLYKLKKDSVADDGYVTHGYLNSHISIPVQQVVSIPAGTANPKIVSPATAFIHGGTGVNTFLKLTSTQAIGIYDVVIKNVYTDSSNTTIDHFEIYSHEDPANPGFSIDNIVVVFYK